MPLTGYPQTHNSPDPEVVTVQHATNQYEGPFGSIKVMSDSNTEAVTLKIFLSKAAYDLGIAGGTEGIDWYTIEALASDTIPGPIYGFVFHTNSAAGSSVIGYRYSTGI